MSDEPEATLEQIPEGDELEQDEAEAEDPSVAEANRRAELREQLAVQLQKRLPKKPEKARKPRKFMTGIEAEKYSLRCRRSDDPLFSLRVHAYNMHRYRVKLATAVVDTSAPNVGRNKYSKPTNFNRRLHDFTKIERENAMMVRRIAKILEGPGMVDHKLTVVGKTENKSGRTRQMNLLCIALANLALLKRLQDMKPMYDTQKLLAEYKKNEDFIQRLSLYPLYWKKVPLKGWEDHMERALGRGPKASVFLILATETKRLGQVVIELNFEVTPMTSENFLCLCTGEQGLSYKCSQIHRIVPGILWQGGDVTGQEGFGNKSIYGDTFPDENFRLKHDDAGVVSMANCGPDSNGSQFIITARSTPALDGTNVVFGKVTSGMKVLEKLKDYLGSTGVPKCDIFIQDCGFMEPGMEPEPDEDEVEAKDAETEAEEAEDTEGAGSPTTTGSNLQATQDKTNILAEEEQK